MKIRLTQPGFETYTGQMGVVFFEDGLSTTDVKPIDAVRIAAQFVCEWEDGTTASVTQSLLDHSHTTLCQLPPELDADKALADQAAEAAALASTNSEPAEATTYTEDELAEIADKGGIKALRVIGDGLGVKGQSIADLIKAILEKQKA